MEIYIKGMEMPKDGYRQVFIDSNGTVTWFNNGADGLNTMYKAKAFPVPPHGDLIDRDVLYDHMCQTHDKWRENPQKHMSINPFTDDETMVLYAPTVIPIKDDEKPKPAILEQ